MGVASLVTGKQALLVALCGVKLRRKIHQLNPTTRTRLARNSATKGIGY